MSKKQESIIKGIDVSESVSTATNNDVYYYCSQKAVDELQNTIKRLQEENEGFKSLNDFNVQKIEVLQEENEELKADLKGETEQCQKWYQLETDKHFQMLKYRKALEEIRENLIKLDTNDEDDFCYEFSKLQSKIDEVLNDRD